MRTRTIDSLLRTAAAREGVISFAGGLPANETFPHKALAQASAEAAGDVGTTALQYEWPEGRLKLRELIAAKMRARGALVGAENIIVTNGAQDALALAVEVIGAMQVQVGRVTYPGALDIFEAAQCEAATRPHSFVYVMPAVSNPLGSTMNAAERALALEADLIIEDDAYADLLFSGPPGRPLLADAPDKVFFVGTFSKTLAPGLRVGWLIAPKAVRAKVLALKQKHDIQACGLTQAVVERLMTSPEFEPRLQKLRAHYKQRSERLLNALSHLPNVKFSVPLGGFSVWLETEVDGSDASWLYVALENGVAFDPGGLFRPTDDLHHPLAMRLSFSSIAMDQIEPGVARLDKALRSTRVRNVAA